MYEKKFLGRLVIILLLWSIMTGVSGIHYRDTVMSRLSLAFAAIAVLGGLRLLMIALVARSQKRKKQENIHV